MTWVRLDDGFADHPKILELSDRAFRVHVAALCYSARHLTDGKLSVSAQKSLGLTPKISKELETAGLWKTIAGGMEIHDFTVYQPTRAKVLEERHKQAERQRRSRERHAVTDDEVTPSVTRDNPRDTDPMSRRDYPRESRRESQDPDPARPLPGLTRLGDYMKEKTAFGVPNSETNTETDSQHSEQQPRVEEGFPL